VPFAQTNPDAHALPQLPQLEWSESRFTQEPLHSLPPLAVHGETQPPSTHT
jgi:hypothetical protein